VKNLHLYSNFIPLAKSAIPFTILALKGFFKASPVISTKAFPKVHATSPTLSFKTTWNLKKIKNDF
jgi:hypothetical protein